MPASGAVSDQLRTCASSSSLMTTSESRGSEDVVTGGSRGRPKPSKRCCSVLGEKREHAGHPCGFSRASSACWRPRQEMQTLWWSFLSIAWPQALGQGRRLGVGRMALAEETRQRGSRGMLRARALARLARWGQRAGRLSTRAGYGREEKFEKEASKAADFSRCRKK